MRINQNIMAFNAYRNLSGTNAAMSKSLEKLSSGFRINRAADDAAGLVISQNLRAQVSALRVATRNAQDGISVVQTAEGALNEVHSLLNRMRDLAVQAANTGSSDETARNAASAEVSQGISEINRILATTKFGNQGLFADYNGVFQVGANAEANSQITVAIGTVSTNDAGSVALSLVDGDPVAATAASLEAAADAAGFDFSGGNTLSFAIAVDGGAAQNVEVNTDVTNISGLVAALNAATTGATWSNDGNRLTVTSDTTGADSSIVIDNVSDGGGGNSSGIVAGSATGTAADDGSGVAALVAAGDTSAIGKLDEAIAAISTLRGDLGAIQNRFESTVANLQVTTENLAASESRIRDTDMALEMVSFTRHQILLQAGTAMLGQANALPQSVLRLLG